MAAVCSLNVLTICIVYNVLLLAHNENMLDHLTMHWIKMREEVKSARCEDELYLIITACWKSNASSYYTMWLNGYISDQVEGELATCWRYYSNPHENLH